MLAASGDPGGTQRQRGRHRLAAGALAPAARARRRLVAQGRPRALVREVCQRCYLRHDRLVAQGRPRALVRGRPCAADSTRWPGRCPNTACRPARSTRIRATTCRPADSTRGVRRPPRLRRVPPAARRRNAGRLLVAGDARARAVRARRGSRPRHRPPRPRRECAALAEWAAHRTAGRGQEAWTAANVGQRPTVNATDRTAGRGQEAWTGTRCGKRRGSPRRRTGGVRRMRGRGPGAARAGSIRSPWRAAARRMRGRGPGAAAGSARPGRLRGRTAPDPERRGTPDPGASRASAHPAASRRRTRQGVAQQGTQRAYGRARRGRRRRCRGRRLPRREDQNRDAAIQVSERSQLRSNSASTSGDALPCAASAVLRPKSDQPLLGWSASSAR